MKKENKNIELNRIGLFKVFSNMDTQSAVVAALVISFVTLVTSEFINLCNYIYWNAYFTKFNIPLSYIDEAIIHENGTKYLVALLVPLLVFFWWLLTVIKNGMMGLYSKLKEKRDNRLKEKPTRRKHTYIETVLKISYTVFFILLSFAGILYLLLWGITQKKYIILILGIELFIFILCSLCKTIFGNKRTFSKKMFYGTRIFFVFFAVYAVLGGVYFSGSFDNYENKSAQSLQIINDSNVNFYTLKNEDSINSQLVLFETKDYYYVTDVTINGGSTLGVLIWDDDTYRFIDKIDCPVKTVWANLYYVGGNKQVTWKYMNDLSLAYAITTFSLSVTFICLLSVPLRKEEQEEPEETVTPKSST